jgi:RNA polymerase sigma-70 factor (ECF subfamily)
MDTRTNRPGPSRIGKSPKETDRMNRPEESTERWTRLLALLDPVHERTRATARRLARTRADGDDLFQEAVLVAHRKLSSLRDESRFPGWFYAILLSVHRSRARRSAWRRFLSLESEMEHGFDPPDAAGGGNAEERWRAERASRALASLPAVQREAVVLFEIEGYSIEEVAAWQQASVPAVKARLQRGRSRLRLHYERLLGNVPGAAVKPAGADRPLEEGRAS